MQEPWLKEFKPTNIKLLCSVYFGTVKLRSKTSTVQSVLVSEEADSYGTVTYKMTFPREKFVFDDLDPSQYDVEEEMGGFPFAVVRVDYSHQEENRGISAPITLGWSRIKMYQHRSVYHLRCNRQHFHTMIGLLNKRPLWLLQDIQI